MLIISLGFTLNFLQAQESDPWATYMNPGEVHQLLNQYQGEFNLTLKMIGGPDPVEFPLKSDNQMVMGGRFLQFNQSGSFGGMDYESITTVGFNTVDKTMSLTTITNMGTGTLALVGKWDEATKSANLKGQLTNPVTKTAIQVRQRITFATENSIIIESFDQEGSKDEIKTVEYSFTRQ